MDYSPQTIRCPEVVGLIGGVAVRCNDPATALVFVGAATACRPVCPRCARRLQRAGVRVPRGSASETSARPRT